ncbi:MAG TPA: hypothetical protein VIW24_25740 [Aldersonia sp.]
MSIPITGGLSAEQAEAFFNLAHNGVLTRIDEHGQRCGELYQWAHTHTPPRTGVRSPPMTQSFAATYPLPWPDRRP